MIEYGKEHQHFWRNVALCPGSSNISPWRIIADMGEQFILTF